MRLGSERAKIICMTAGAFWHRSRASSPMEPGLLAEDARCPPPSRGGRKKLTCLWSGAIRIGCQAGGTMAPAASSVERSRRHCRHVCFCIPPVTRGTESRECGGSWRREVRLREAAGSSSGSAAAVLACQDRVRRPPRYPRYRPGPMGRRRRGHERQEIPRNREIPLVREERRDYGNSRLEGGLGTRGVRRDAGIRPPPTAGSWFQS